MRYVVSACFYYNQIAATNKQIKRESDKQRKCVLHMLLYTYFFYKQPVNKQLTLGWQISKQFSGLNPVSLSHSKNYRLKKSRAFPL